MRLRLLLPLVPVLLAGQSLQEFEKKVTEFTLANGMHFLIIERHDAPVVSFNTYANVGSVDDPSGETGIAHMGTDPRVLNPHCQAHDVKKLFVVDGSCFTTFPENNPTLTIMVVRHYGDFTTGADTIALFVVTS